MSDLVQRLRDCWDGARGTHYDYEHDLIREAADRIEALEAELEEVKRLIFPKTIEQLRFGDIAERKNRQERIKYWEDK